MIRFRPTVAEVDLEAIRRNVRTLKPDAVELMAVVKANAYGHGDVAVATAALDAGASWLGVALIEEGIRLREAGITAPILLLTEFPPGGEKDALAADLTPTVYTAAGLTALSEAASALGRPARVHVKVDTGMHRVGLPPGRAAAFCTDVLDLGMELDGVWTHFARSEELDEPTTARQLAAFRSVLGELQAAGINPRYRHAANTGAAVAIPESHLDLVRVGIGLFGLAPAAPVADRVKLAPAMSLRSRVGFVQRLDAGEAVSYGHRYRLDRPSTIATVPVGYADGYPRALSDAGRVLIRGRRYPIAGTITMDQLMVDCGEDRVEPGDEVVLFGRQGDEEISATEVADRTGTIAYEIVCGISERVPREYRG
ncbi:MAG TPA: alanine racemase [Actinomycetota bacterium]|nr:alanine racemase [Actinomycetota bacterium]